MLNAEVKNEISNCIAILRKGGIAVFPTSAGWIAGCDISNRDVTELMNSSGTGDHPAILLAEAGNLQRYLREIPESLFQLIEYTAKPIHLFHDAAVSMPPGVDPEKVAFTFANDEFTKSLTRGFGKPLYTLCLKDRNHPEKSEKMFNNPLYVVNLRSGMKNNTDNLVIVRFSKTGSFNIIKK